MDPQYSDILQIHRRSLQSCVTALGPISEKLQMRSLCCVLLLFSLCYGYLPPYPVLWDTVQFSSFPRDGSDGRVEVNAWNYTHRLALYQRILSGTPHCLWNSGHGNPVWLQTLWLTQR